MRWIVVLVIIVVFGWLYFNAKLRTLRMRDPLAQRQEPEPESVYAGSPSAGTNSKS